MANSTASRASPATLLPVLLFGTRFISGLIFRPREGSENGSEVHEAVEEECGEGEAAAGAAVLLEAEEPVKVDEEVLYGGLQEASCSRLTPHHLEEETISVEEEEEIVEETEEKEEKGKEAEDGAGKSWDTLSLPSVVPSDLSEDTLHATACLDPCSRTVLLEQWLRSLSLGQALGFTDRFPVNVSEEEIQEPERPIDLEAQMQRTNMFTNPFFFSLTPRVATPRSSTPRAITPAGGLSSRKKNARITPLVEPLVLHKKKQSGAVTTRAEDTPQIPPGSHAQTREKNLSSISVVATPRQVWAPGQTSILLSGNTWVRARANPGLELNPYQRSSKPGLKSICIQSSRDSVEATC